MPIKPTLEYADIIWSPHQKYLVYKLERVQNLALRFIFSNYSRFTSVSDLRKRADLRTLSDCRMISRLKFLYLLFHDHYKIPRTNYLQAPFRHSSRTNHNRTIRQPHSNIITHKYSLFPSAIGLWNRLPAAAVNSTSVECFLRAINDLEF